MSNGNAEHESYVQKRALHSGDAREGKVACNVAQFETAIQSMNDLNRNAGQIVRGYLGQLLAMVTRLLEILQQLSSLLPSGGVASQAVGTAQGAITSAIGSAAAAVTEVAAMAPLIGQASSGLNSLNSISNEIDTASQANQILLEAQNQYTEFIKVLRKIEQWLRFQEETSGLIRELLSLPYNCPREAKEYGIEAG